MTPGGGVRRATEAEMALLEAYHERVGLLLAQADDPLEMWKDVLAVALSEFVSGEFKRKGS